MCRKYEPVDQPPEEESNIKEKKRYDEEELESLKKRFSKRFLVNPEKNLSEDDTAEKSSPFSLDLYSFPPLTDETRQKIEKFKNITAAISENTIAEGNHLTDSPLKEKYRPLLNPSQFAAATTINGPLLVIAGAGSGKTRTLIHRTAYLIESGIKPESILLLTFTRKAAQEMVKRSASLMQNVDASKMFAGTFHSFSNFILRKYSGLLNIFPNFTIIDQVDSADIVDLIKREMKFEKKEKKFPRKSTIFAIISRSRNLEIPVKQTIFQLFPAAEEYIKEIEIISELYGEYKKAQRTFDYDDLLYELHRHLETNQKFREKIQHRYTHLMVDEFQDTNIIQKKIVDLIAAAEKNIMVVGDDSQSIYSFRGAHFENILLFPETWPDCKIIRIEQNYRSNQAVLDFTNSIIESATIAYRKKLFSQNNNDFKPRLKSLTDAEDEATYIVSKILEHRTRVPLNEIAVLYRSSFHGTHIQAELLRHNIPYVVYGGIKFVERRHIKDLLSYLKIILNPYDAVAWNRVLKLLSGIGNVTASSIIEKVTKNTAAIDVSPFKGKKYYHDLEKLAKTLNRAKDPAYSIIAQMETVKAHYLPILREVEGDIDNRVHDLNVLTQLAQQYKELEKFLTDFALDPPSSKLNNNNSPMIDEFEEQPLILSTVHSAKGLEWNTVFVPHLLDGYFPSDKSLNRLEDIEEERRLFYVACSRAKEHLYLTWPATAAFWKGFLTLPSRFIAEIDREMYEID